MVTRCCHVEQRRDFSCSLSALGVGRSALSVGRLICHSIGGFGIPFNPTRKTTGQITFRVCSGAPHARRSSYIISFNGSLPVAAMNRLVDDNVRMYTTK